MLYRHAIIVYTVGKKTYFQEGQAEITLKKMYILVTPCGDSRTSMICITDGDNLLPRIRHPASAQISVLTDGPMLQGVHETIGYLIAMERSWKHGQGVKSPLFTTDRSFEETTTLLCRVKQRHRRSNCYIRRHKTFLRLPAAAVSACCRSFSEKYVTSRC